MIGLVMAGGKGTRMDISNEKLLLEYKKPVIFHVIDALKNSHCFSKVIVATSPNSPDTKQALEQRGIETLATPGNGYVSDLNFLLQKMDEFVFVISGDLPLLDEKIDIAVHALKDMPSDETKGLITNCFLQRNDPREILISKDNKHIKDLASNATVGTSSFRREFQLKKIREDLNYKLIRGNVDTRIKKLNDGLFDAIILSYAGIQSLNLNKKISQIFSTSEIIPSAGQGVVALQCRENDEDLIK